MLFKTGDYITIQEGCVKLIDAKALSNFNANKEFKRFNNECKFGSFIAFLEKKGLISIKEAAIHI